jgi:hypothetical protein
MQIQAKGGNLTNANSRTRNHAKDAVFSTVGGAFNKVAQTNVGNHGYFN